MLSVRRTLVEKILGVIKDSYNDDPAAKLSDRIRHLYDIRMILSEDEHRQFVQSDEFNILCDLCIEDEKTGFFKNSDCFENPLVEAPLFSDFDTWRPSLEATYKGVFSELVYGELPAMDEISDALMFLHKHLK